MSDLVELTQSPGRYGLRVDYGVDVRRGDVSGVVAPAPGLSYLLDGTPGFVAYSFRKLASSANLCVRIRRTSDNAEQDFGFVGEPGSEFLDLAAITTFLGASTGAVSVWYDQSSQGVDIVNTTAASQPIIYSNGFYSSRVASPTLRFLSEDNLYATVLGGLQALTDYVAAAMVYDDAATQVSTFTKRELELNSEYGDALFYFKSPGTQAGQNNVYAYSNADGSGTASTGTASDIDSQDTANVAMQVVMKFDHTAKDHYLYRKKRLGIAHTWTSSADVGTSMGAVSSMRLNSTSSTAAGLTDSRYHEVIVFGSRISNDRLTAIRVNQRNYWGI